MEDDNPSGRFEEDPEDLQNEYHILVRDEAERKGRTKRIYENIRANSVLTVPTKDKESEFEEIFHEQFEQAFCL